MAAAGSAVATPGLMAFENDYAFGFLGVTWCYSVGMLLLLPSISTSMLFLLFTPVRVFMPEIKFTESPVVGNVVLARPARLDPLR